MGLLSRKKDFVEAFRLPVLPCLMGAFLIGTPLCLLLLTRPGTPGASLPLWLGIVFYAVPFILLKVLTPLRIFVVRNCLQARYARGGQYTGLSIPLHSIRSCEQVPCASPLWELVRPRFKREEGFHLPAPGYRGTGLRIRHVAEKRFAWQEGGPTILIPVKDPETLLAICTRHLQENQEESTTEPNP